MYTIMTVGTGYVGEAIAKEFIARKQKVIGITRSERKGEVFRALGITPLCLDLNDPKTLSEIPPAHFIVISVAPDSRDEQSYRKTYLEGVNHFLEAMGKNPRPNLILYISSTGVWEQSGVDWIDETHLPKPRSARAKILLEAESQVLNSGYPAIILRLSGIYGPNRNRLSRLDSIQISPENKWMNMIHLEDVVQSIPVIFNKGTVGEVYIGTDCEPVTRKEFYAWLNLRNDHPKIKAQCGVLEQGQPIVTGKRLKNHKLLELGLNLKFPTFRKGYEAL